MSSRLELNQTLVDILGSRNVYFQPPESVKINYPCIIYRRSGADTKHANDKLYLNKTKYTITIIDKDPDSPIPGRVSELQLCSFDRHFSSNSLNHDVYTLYH